MSEEITQPETEAPAQTLTLNDLVLSLQVIQLVTQRGAIKAEEMSTIGGLYDRLYRFLS